VAVMEVVFGGDGSMQDCEGLSNQASNSVGLHNALAPLCCLGQEFKAEVLHAVAARGGWLPGGEQFRLGRC
jgi:hypothetical protein